MSRATFFVFLLSSIAGVLPALAQIQEFTGASLTSTGTVRFVTQPTLPNPDSFLLESSDSPTGPWYKETEWQRKDTAGGYEFITPRKDYLPQKFYRIGTFSAGPSIPFIQYISPNSNVRTGLVVSLLGANFNPTPAGNMVHFDLPNQSFTAVVTAATSNSLVVTVPPNLPTTNTGNGFLYRVTVETTNGVSNGVGCWVFPTSDNTFMIRPDLAFLIQPPGTGKETLVIGGGVPPYRLLPLSASESNIASATLSGSVVTVTTVNTNLNFGGITVRVADSSVVTQQVSASVLVEKAPFTPTVVSTFHTLLAGTAPGFMATISFVIPSLLLEKAELRFTNVGIEVSRLAPGDIIGLLRTFYSSSVYGYQHLVVTEVVGDRAKFDVLSISTDSGVTTVAQGQLIENPPTVVMNIGNQIAAAVLPTSFDQELFLTDDIFRLPAAGGQGFSVATTFTSVSSREDRYAPNTFTVVTNFVTTNTISGAPLINRLLPVHGEVGCNVHIVATNIHPIPANNQVTFAGMGGTRTTAQIILQTNNDIYVTVPRDAITGPVRIITLGKTSNDFTYFVRFHADSLLSFLSGVTNNVPTSFRISEQQPIDDLETIGEVPVQFVTATLDLGRLYVTNLVFDQQVGTNKQINLYTGQQGVYPIVYKGQETQEPKRHVFDVVTSVGSSTALVHIYALDDPDGNGVTFQIERGYLPFNAGSFLDFVFTSPIYRPPPAPGSMAVRLDTMSQEWNSVPNTEMHVIRNSLQQVH